MTITSPIPKTSGCSTSPTTAVPAPNAAATGQKPGDTAESPISPPVSAAWASESASRKATSIRLTARDAAARLTSTP